MPKNTRAGIGYVDWFRIWRSPKAFAERAHEINCEIPNAAELFSKNIWKPLIEILIVADFALTVDQSHQIRIRLGKDQSDADFYIEHSLKEKPFELTEVDRPNRRRGFEYQQVDSGKRSKIVLDDPTQDIEHARRGIPKAIEKKKHKNYSPWRHLLINVNLWWHMGKISDRELIDLTSGGIEHFDSLSLIWGDYLLQTIPKWGWSHRYKSD